MKYELGFYIPEDDILYSHDVKTSNPTAKLLLVFSITAVSSCNFTFIGPFPNYGRLY
jgi:hypothetical protein